MKEFKHKALSGAIVTFLEPETDEDRELAAKMLEEDPEGHYDTFGHHPRRDEIRREIQKARLKVVEGGAK